MGRGAATSQGAPKTQFLHWNARRGLHDCFSGGVNGKQSLTGPGPFYRHSTPQTGRCLGKKTGPLAQKKQSEPSVFYQCFFCSLEEIPRVLHRQSLAVRVRKNGDGHGVCCGLVAAADSGQGERHRLWQGALLFRIFAPLRKKKGLVQVPEEEKQKKVTGLGEGRTKKPAIGGERPTTHGKPKK